MSTLVKRPKKGGGFSFYVDFYYKGKRYFRSCKTDDRKLAKQVLAEVQAKITRSDFNIDEKEQENNITLKDFIEEYLAEARIEKRPGTVKIDEKALRDFAQYAGENIILRQIPESMARSFRAHLVNRKNERKEGNLSPTTSNMRMRCLRTAWNWALAGDRRYVDKNIFAGINQLRVDEKIVRALTMEDVDKLFQVAEADGGRGKGFGRYLTFLLLTGCRRMEAVDLKWGEVNFIDGLITFGKTKTHEDRVVPMNDELRMMLLEMYKEVVRVDNENRVFPYKGDHVSKLFKKYKEKGKLSSHVNLHSLRHTCAMVMRLNGVHTLNIGQTLGHRNLSTTERYARAFPELLRPAVSVLSVKGMREKGAALRKELEEKGRGSQLQLPSNSGE